MPDQPPKSLGSCPVVEPLGDEEIRRLARLTRLTVGDAQIEALRHELKKVLSWAAMLEAADEEDLPEDAPEAGARLDPDLPGRMLKTAVLEQIAPATEGAFLVVPKVLGDGGGEG